MKKLVAIGLVLVMAFSCFACTASPSTETPATVAEPGAAAPAEGTDSGAAKTDEEIKVIYAVGEDYVSIDQVGNNNVQTYTMNPMMFDKYVYSDFNGTLIPGMFTEWSTNADSTDWTFKIREGVRFHDGDAMTAEDVKFTWELWLNDLSAQNSLYTALEEVEVVNDYEVIFHFSSPMASFVNQLPRYGGDLINKSVYEATTREEYFAKPIGCGPFKFVSWTPGGDLVLERNDDWYGKEVFGESNVDTFVFRYIAEDTTRISALETGEVDIIRDIPAEQMDHVKSLEGITFETGDAWTLAMSGFNCGAGKVFNDENARLAVWYGIDRQLICDAILGGGYAWYWPVPKGCDGYDEEKANAAKERTPYDLDKAKEYLAASSYDGSTITVIEPSGAFPRNDEVLQAIVDMMKEIGFNVDLQIMDRTAFNSVRKAGEYDMYVHSNSTAEDTLTWAYYHVVANVGHYDYDNQELIDLVTAAHDAATREEQMKNLIAAYEIMAKVVAPDCMWFALDNRTAFKSNISGFTLNPDQTFDFKTITVG